MVTGAPFSPYATTNASGQFFTQSDGFVQGTAKDDPSSRMWLATGVLASTETSPMWGGVAISENIPLSTVNDALGGSIIAATVAPVSGSPGTAGEITGFSVTDQMYHGVITPQSNAPIFLPGDTVGFYRRGSNARIALKAVPDLVNLDGSVISSQVSWDFVNRQVVPYVAAYAQATPSAYNSYTSATGILQLTFSPAPGPVANSWVSLTGFNDSRLNGTWKVASTASGATILNIQVTAGLGSITPSAGVLAAGGGAIPGRLLQVQASGNKVITYDSSTGAANYSNTGAIALILLN